MYFTDTHTHLYLSEFEADRNECIKQAIAAGVTTMILPNVNSQSIDNLLAIVAEFPKNCFPAIGLHPTYVKENYIDELNIVKKFLETKKFVAIGEIGIDLYWDKTFFKQQQIAFQQQIDLAKHYELPIIIHARESYNEIFEILETNVDERLTGVFHCFGGTEVEAQKAVEMGFKLGIGGVVTYKNSKLPETIKNIDLQHIVIETDAPYLPPVPHRGKRNESSYVVFVAKKLAEIYNHSLAEIASVTTNNAKQLFKIKDLV